MTQTSNPRKATITRQTKETSIEVALNHDGGADVDVDTGIGFLDHLITSLAHHAGFDLQLKATGDLEIDDHHTAEDCAICLGQALDEALDERNDIVRFGYAYAPLDESLARAVVDLSNRPGAYVTLGLMREKLGELACENITHFFQTLAINGRFTLHLDVLRGENDHHRAESAAKALALALRTAVSRRDDSVNPSTKGGL